jgi:hypothetical protein
MAPTTNATSAIKASSSHSSLRSNGRAGRADSAGRQMTLTYARPTLAQQPALQYQRTLTSYGVGWKSFTEQYLDSCGIFRDAVLSILATIAKQERIRLSERTVAGLERARKQGRIGGRPRVVTDRAKVAELRAAGKSLGEIATEMGLAKSTVATDRRGDAGLGFPGKHIARQRPIPALVITTSSAASVAAAAPHIASQPAHCV